MPLIFGNMIVGKVETQVRQEPVAEPAVAKKSPSPRLSCGNIVVKNGDSLKAAEDNYLIEENKVLTEQKKEEALIRLSINKYGITNINQIKDPLVLVNGKTKKISKHSAYLLDMLSLDEE